MIVCAASLKDPRKRAELLFEAFAKLRAERPGAELRIVRPRDPLIFSWEAPERPEGVSWVEASETAELARVYAGADISVLPSVDEAFGLVLVESLAAGTPVVAARSGACPEIVTDDAIGRLFDADDADDLARAMGEAIDQSAEPGTLEACRARARDFDISRALDAFEAIYSEALGCAGRHRVIRAARPPARRLSGRPRQRNATLIAQSEALNRHSAVRPYAYASCWACSSGGVLKRQGAGTADRHSAVTGVALGSGVRVPRISAVRRDAVMADRSSACQALERMAIGSGVASRPQPDGPRRSGSLRREGRP